MTLRHIGLTSLALCVAHAAAVLPAGAQEFPRDVQQMIDAYQAMKTYHMKAVVEGGGQKMEYEVAVDRPAARFRFHMTVPSDDVQMLTVSDGRKLRTRLHAEGQVKPNHHVEVDAPARFDYAGLAQAAPFITQPTPAVLPDLVLMLATDPTRTLSGDGQGTWSVSQVDGTSELSLNTGQYVLTVRPDPTTHLIRSGVLTMRGASLQMTVEPVSRDQPLAAGLFTFDTTGSTAVRRIDELVDQPRQPAQELEGQPAPDFSLSTLDGKPFTLSKEAADVVVLDFWATWCGPCVAALPGLEKLHQWARDEKKSVAIYCVNLREDKDDVDHFWRQKKLTMPVLMDPRGAVAQQYKVSAIPQTVILFKGKVAHVHIGAGPGHEQMLKDEIEALLGKVAAR